jgi:hypothetical protein
MRFRRACRNAQDGSRSIHYHYHTLINKSLDLSWEPYGYEACPTTPANGLLALAYNFFGIRPAR